MTHVTDQRAAQARDDADAAIEAASELPDVDRGRRVAAVAVELLHQHSPDRLDDAFSRYAFERLAWLSAEQAVRVVESEARRG